MTQADEPRGMHAGQIDAGRHSWRSVVASMVLGLLIGLLAGGAYGDSRVVSFQAKSALSVLPDPTLTSQSGPGGSTLDPASFIQSQLVILNGNQLAAQVQKQLIQASAPTVSSTEIGQTYVVQVTATSTTRQRALAVTTAVATIYTAQRYQQLTAQINTLIDSTKVQLAAVVASLATARGATPTVTGVTPAETALQAQYQQLLTLNSTLQLALTQANRVVTVLSPATISTPPISVTTKFLIAGALLGALLGLVILVVVRRTLARIRTIGDVVALDVNILLPVIPRQRFRIRRRNPARPSSSGRLLAARLTGAGSALRQPLIVVGATRRVGTTFVATSLALGLAERGSVLLILASDLVNRPVAREPASTPAHNGTKRPSADSGPASQLMQRIVPGPIQGVSVLACSTDAPELSYVPSTRLHPLLDVIDQATADGWLVVVDAPALGDSDLALDCARPDSVIALVAARSSSRPGDILTASELFQAHGKQLAGVILNDPPPRLLQRLNRARPTASPVPTNVRNRPKRPAPTASSGRRRTVANGHSTRTTNSTVTLSDLMAREFVPPQPERQS